jgi:excisionase family DNA binding protein
MEPILIDKKEASRLLSLSLRTVEGLIARGAFPVRHIGRRTLILRDALEKFAQHRSNVAVRTKRTNREERESALPGSP